MSWKFLYRSEKETSGLCGHHPLTPVCSSVSGGNWLSPGRFSTIISGFIYLVSSSVLLQKLILKFEGTNCQNPPCSILRLGLRDSANMFGNVFRGSVSKR